MSIFQNGLQVKLISQYRNHKEEILAWLYFLGAMLITIIIFYVSKNFLAQGLYNRTTLNSQYASLSKYDKSLKKILEADFTKLKLKDIEEITGALDDLARKYRELHLEPRMHIKVFTFNFGYNADEFNKIVEDRLTLIHNLKEKLFKYKIYLFSTETYKKFDNCIKKLDFSKDDKEISSQLNKCIAPVNITQIQEYSKILNCKELEKLADYFNAYKNLSRYYYFLSLKRYKEAQKYKEEARKRINVNIKWEVCFDFLGK